MKDYKKIKVIRRSGRKVKIKNNKKSLKLIGKGVQGAVFKLSTDQCVKVYAKKEHRKQEEAILRYAQDSPFFPKIYDTGKNYIVMEYIKGPTLKEYLEIEKKLERIVTEKIIAIVKELKRLEIPRKDIKLRHIILSEDGQVKIIDHVNAHQQKSKPKKLFQVLSEIGLLEPFLQQVKEIDQDLYSEWRQSMFKYYPMEFSL